MTIVSGKNESKNQNNGKALNYQVGDIVQGTVTKVTDQISIQFNEKTAGVSKDILPNAKEGDLLNFRFMGLSTDGTMSLQYISEEAGKQGGKPAIFTAVLNEWKGQQLQDSGVIETESGVDKEKKDLKEIDQKMSEEDYRDLSKEGFSLERFELERFDRALERIKTQRTDLKHAMDTRVETVKEEEDALKEAGLAKIDDPMIKAQIATMLESMNLPASQQNIAAVSSAVKLASQVVNLSDASMSYLLSNQMEPTPVNIYMANYNGKSEQTTDVPDREADWSKLEKQVTNLLEQFHDEGIKATQEEAKWLFDHGIAINEDTIASYQQLKVLQEHLSLDSAITAIIKGMTQGKQAMDASLATGNEVEVQTAVQQFKNISDQALQSVIEQKQTVNLINLEAAMKADTISKQQEEEVNLGLSLSQEATDSQTQAQNETELQKELNLVTARRQLEEIRLKLTYEAGIKLAGKGIRIQTEGLDSLVTELRGLEEEYYQKLLIEGGAKVEDKSIELLKTTLEYKEIVSQSPNYVLAVKFEERNQMTLSRLAEEAIGFTEQFHQANEAYESLMTAPRSDLGDSINKAFANMDSLLEEMGIESTDANKRAVRILSYNQMEINETSIEQMKEYDLQVRSLIEELKPSTTVQLIKREVNPLDTPIGELKDYIHEIVREQGQTDEEKYSNYLAKIQKSGTLTSEQRETYIGVYRLLNNVEKSDGKAIGYLVRSGRELTLNNLLSSVRTIKGDGLDARIDDSFGLLQGVNYSTKRIGDQLNASFEGATELEVTKTSYNNQLSSQLYEQITPDFLQYVQSSGDLMDLTMEQLNQRYQEYKNLYPQSVTGEYEALLSQVQEAMNMTDEMRFLKSYHTKVSLENVTSANVIRNHPSELRQGMKEILSRIGRDFTTDDRVLEDSESFLEFEANYEKVVNSMTHHLRESFEDPTLTVEDMLALNGYLKNTSLLQELGERKYYQIPLEVSGQIVEVGLSLQSGSQERGKISIHMDSETFGQIQTELKLENQHLKGFVLCENKSMASVLKRTMDHVIQDLPEDILSTQIHVCAQDQDMKTYVSTQTEEAQNQQQTERLFQIAKLFLSHVKEVDFLS